jgi:hypothetical protein
MDRVKSGMSPPPPLLEICGPQTKAGTKLGTIDRAVPATSGKNARSVPAKVGLSVPSSSGKTLQLAVP